MGCIVSIINSRHLKIFSTALFKVNNRKTMKLFILCLLVVIVCVLAAPVPQFLPGGPIESAFWSIAEVIKSVAASIADAVKSVSNDVRNVRNPGAAPS